MVRKKKKVKSLSHVQLFAISWTIARQAPLFVGSSRQEYWSGLPSPSPRNLPNPGIEPRSPALQADSLPAELPGKMQKMDPLAGWVHRRNKGVVEMGDSSIRKAMGF